MTSKGLAQIISLFEQTYGITFSPEQQRVWLMVLEPLTDDEAQKAAIETLRESPHVPKPADLWRRARPVTALGRTAEDLLEQEADLAVAFLRDHVNDMAADYGLFLNAVVRAYGGLQAVVDTFLDERWSFELPRWRNLYKAIARRGIAPNDEDGRPNVTQRYLEHINQPRERGHPSIPMTPPLVTLPFLPETPGLEHLPYRSAYKRLRPPKDA